MVQLSGPADQAAKTLNASYCAPNKRFSAPNKRFRCSISLGNEVELTVNPGMVKSVERIIFRYTLSLQASHCKTHLILTHYLLHIITTAGVTKNYSSQFLKGSEEKEEGHKVHKKIFLKCNTFTYVGKEIRNITTNQSKGISFLYQP